MALDLPRGSTGKTMTRRLFPALLGGLFVLTSGAAVVAARPDTPPRTGRYRGDLADPATGDLLMRVAMQVPDTLPAERHLGLILLFHGFRGHENNYIGLTVASLKRL